jgi:hypothetical protein
VSVCRRACSGATLAAGVCRDFDAAQVLEELLPDQDAEAVAVHRVLDAAPRGSTMASGSVDSRMFI